MTLDVKRRLDVIDCLRGAAASAVVIHHVFLTHSSAHTGPVWYVEQVMTLGFTGVWLFIVLSGFCIHLRVAAAQAAGSDCKLEFVPFWKRRIRRLYPAYFVALVIYAGVRLAEGSVILNEFFIYDFIMHLFMLHNLDERTVHGFCGVFWTLALEEQLYLAYFALLYLRKKLGWRWTLIVCLMARVAIYALHWWLSHTRDIHLPTQALFPAQWFIWALGALSVEWRYGLVKLPTWCHSARIGLMILAFTATLIVFDRMHPLSTFSKPIWFCMDLLLGAGFFICLNACVASEADLRAGRMALIARRVLVPVGLFSYSLYLTHQMILLHLAPTIARLLDIQNDTVLLLLLAPLCYIWAWIFYRMFERPFLKIRKRPAGG